MAHWKPLLKMFRHQLVPLGQVIFYLCFLPKMPSTSLIFYCLFITTEALWIYMAFMLCCCCYFSESGKEIEVNAFAQPPTFYNLLHLYLADLVYSEKTGSCVHLEVAFSPVNDSESESHLVMSDSFQPHRLYSSWNFPGQNTRVGSLSLLQGIFPSQRSNPGLPHRSQILYQLSHKGRPANKKCNISNIS